MTEDQPAPAGLAGVIDLLEAMMRSLEERPEPPPPPPTLWARIRRLVSRETVVDQCGRVVRAMLRAKLRQLASGLEAAVAADLKAGVGAPADGTAEPETSPRSSDTGASGVASSGGNVQGGEGAPGSLALAGPESDASDAGIAASPDADEHGGGNVIEAGAADGRETPANAHLRTLTFSDMLLAGVSREALAHGQAAAAHGAPAREECSTQSSDPTMVRGARVPASRRARFASPRHGTMPPRRVDVRPRRVKWQEARGPDHPPASVFSRRSGLVWQPRRIRCVFATDPSEVPRAVACGRRHGCGLTPPPLAPSVAATLRGTSTVANELKKLWAEGKACVNGWLAIPSGFSAEVMAQCGFNAVTVDMQHGVQDYMSMVACFQAMQAHPVTPLVRVPWNEPGIIGKVLDGGAMGVICPMINTKDEAERLVSYAKYPPHGARSNGPIRAAMYGEATGYQVTANDETLVIPMIETKQAIESIEDILDVPGIAGIYVGPSDLAFSYGKTPKLDHEDEFFLKIYDKLIVETKKRGIYAGIHTGSAAYAARAIGMGFRLTTIANDSGLMAMAAKAAVAQVRKETNLVA